MRRHLPLPPARIADVGAGSGPYSIWLTERGHSVIARDLVPSHVEQLKEAAAARGLVIDAGVADARDLDLEDQAVEMVLSLALSTT